MMMEATVTLDAALNHNHVVLHHVDHHVVFQLTLDVLSVEELGDAGKGKYLTAIV